MTKDTNITMEEIAERALGHYYVPIIRIQQLLSDPAILAHIPAHAELVKEVERLKDTYGESGLKTYMLLETYRSRLHGLCQGKEPASAEEAAENIRQQKGALKQRIADLESQLAALQAGGQPYAYEVHTDATRQELVYADYYKSIGIEPPLGSLPLYTQAPASVQPTIAGKVPEEMEPPITTFDPADDALAERYVAGWNDCRRAMLSAAPNTQEKGE